MEAFGPISESNRRRLTIAVWRRLTPDGCLLIASDPNWQLSTERRVPPRATVTSNAGQPPKAASDNLEKYSAKFAKEWSPKTLFRVTISGSMRRAVVDS